MPPRRTTHPTAQDLLAFGQGKLTGGAAETVAQHLETCDICRSSVANAPADSFVGLVQSAKRKAPAGTRLGASPSLMGDDGTAPLPPQDVPPELAEHPRFRIVRELGRGGMGVVYQAEHRLMERTVAIKVISRSVLEHPEALARFHGEVKAAAQLQHANIVAAYDAEQAGDLHMLVMEFVTGIDLAKLVEKKGPLPVVHACHYIRQAALGLQHAFERGMVHRDIKPQNLMLTPKGQVKILDFGLARMARKQQAGRGLTQADQFMGTPEYVAPEQATDARSADVRADIYSLGCTLYCLLAGRPPFVEETVVKLVLAHIEKEPTPLHEVRPEVSPELSAVVARMLAKSPTERFQTPAEVVQALTPFCKPAAKEAAPPASPKRETRLGSDTPVAKGSLVNRSELGKPKREEQRPQPSGRPPSSGDRRRWAVLVAAAMALPLLLAGIIIVIKWTTKKDGSSTELSVTIKDSDPAAGKPTTPAAGTNAARNGIQPGTVWKGTSEQVEDGINKRLFPVTLTILSRDDKTFSAHCDTDIGSGRHILREFRGTVDGEVVRFRIIKATWLDKDFNVTREDPEAATAVDGEVSGDRFKFRAKWTSPSTGKSYSAVVKLRLEKR